MKKKILQVGLGAIAIALAGSVQAGPRPNVVDSTGFVAGVVGTPLPVGLGADAVSNMISQQITQITNTTGSLPPGYQQITIPMGNRALGQDASGLAAAGYYYALNYPATAGGAGAGACAGYAGSGKVIVDDTSYTDAWGQFFPGPTYYTVCEPQGTRSTLQKVIGSTLLNLSLADINAFAIPNTRGLNTGTATHVCQARGFTDFVQGSLTYYYIGSGCSGNGYVTQWDGSAWTYGAACYNQILTSAQCWK